MKVRECDIVLHADQSDIVLETLDSGLWKRVSVDVVHYVHDKQSRQETQVDPAQEFLLLRNALFLWPVGDTMRPVILDCRRCVEDMAWGHVVV